MGTSEQNKTSLWTIRLICWRFYRTEILWNAFMVKRLETASCSNKCFKKVSEGVRSRIPPNPLQIKNYSKSSEAAY